VFESDRSEFVESEIFLPMTFALDQTLAHSDTKRLVDSEPTVLPRLLIHDDPISRPMTHRLTSLSYIYVFDVWVHIFDKLKWAPTCALLPWWMYLF